MPGRSGNQRSGALLKFRNWFTPVLRAPAFYFYRYLGLDYFKKLSHADNEDSNEQGNDNDNEKNIKESLGSKDFFEGIVT